MGSMLVTVPNIYFINVQKIDYHNAQFVQLPNSRSWDQTWSTMGLSRLRGFQIEIGS
jgi:hypothetical protein